MTGTISKLNVELGERVVGTAQMAGTELLRVANLSRMETRVDVNENDIVRVKLNDTALIEIDAYVDQKFKGVVTQIANSASLQGVSADQVTSFEVRILLLEESYKHLISNRNKNPFRPGMSTTVEILTETRNNVLSVPIQAVTTRSDSVSTGAKGFEEVAEASVELDKEEVASVKTNLNEIVFITSGDTAKMVQVKTGIQNNAYIDITSGLRGNEEVIVAPYSAISRKLQNGKLVQKTKKEDLFKENK